MDNSQSIVTVSYTHLRLGIRAVKEELEDLSLRYLDPMGYQEIEHALELHKDERADFIQKIKTQILEKMLPVIPKVHLEGRVKSINGIYHKMFVQGKSIDQIYDCLLYTSWR